MAVIPTKTLRLITFIFFLRLTEGFSPTFIFPLHDETLQIATKRRSVAYFAVKISMPSSEEAAEMGIREWPQQLKSGSWNEEISDGQEIVRYILDGIGNVEIKEKDGVSTVNSIGPGSLLEVSDEAKLIWRSNSDDMIILTPGYEQTGLFLGVALALVLLTAVGTTLLGGT
eukprot:CAMPEP_0194212440 /NCGR_PEP_ID=MMETSP0156-20130528/12321_1 /TAXON_ID=33649 /ORGANISM="Thalassionema nitzschioides, Strain L26-B" /LENGTH=170 /DNA_ID=CAMNT_0038940265 /DNA_START=78 /DNA_END=590 /DNA_ORIENTATION=+